MKSTISRCENGQRTTRNRQCPRGFNLVDKRVCACCMKQGYLHVCKPDPISVPHSQLSPSAICKAFLEVWMNHFFQWNIYFLFSLSSRAAKYHLFLLGKKKKRKKQKRNNIWSIPKYVKNNRKGKYSKSYKWWNTKVLNDTAVVCHISKLFLIASTMKIGNIWNPGSYRIFRKDVGL